MAGSASAARGRFLGTLVSLAAFGLYDMGVVRMPANRASLAINLVPTVALIVDWVMLGGRSRHCSSKPSRLTVASRRRRWPSPCVTA